MLYPQNGDSIVTVDYVTSLHPMYKIFGAISIRRTYIVKYVYILAYILYKIRLLIDEIVLLKDMVKQTIICQMLR